MPRYEIQQETRGDLQVYRLIDHGRRAEAHIYPQLGFNCAVFRTTPDPHGKDPTGHDSAPAEVFLPPAEIEDLRTKSPFLAGNPILFPFPNRVRQGVYTFEGQTYRMENLMASGRDQGAGQAIHGLVADKAWTVGEAYADDGAAVLHAALELGQFPDIMEQYPFPCTLEVRYGLREGVLTMHTSVQNTGQKTMPMGFGIHPWFPARLRPGVSMPQGLGDITPQQRAQALVHVPADAIWELDHLMPTGKVVPVTEAGDQFDLRQFTPLSGHFFDHVFTGVRHRADGWSEGGLRDPETGLEMYLAADGKFREWVLYAPLNAPVIALEPYTCTTDAVNLEPRGIDAGLIALPPGETWSGDIHFGLRHVSIP